MHMYLVNDIPKLNSCFYMYMNSYHDYRNVSQTVIMPVSDQL